MSLSNVERHLPLYLWPLWGIAIAPVRLWQWSSCSCGGAWCWTMDGQREPLRFRVGVALAMVQTRYFT